MFNEKGNIKNLVSSVEGMRVRDKQILALHFIKELDLENTSNVIGISTESIRKRVKFINKYLWVKFGKYFGDERAEKIEENATHTLSLFLNYKGDDGIAEKEIEENRGYYVQKFGDYLEKHRKKTLENISFNFTNKEKKVLYKHWEWQMYIPQSFTEKDITAYREKMKELIVKRAEESFFDTIEVEGEVLVNNFGDFIFYYVGDFTIDDMSEMMGVERDEVFNSFEKVRRWADYTMSGYYELERLDYSNETYLPKDIKLINIIKIVMEYTGGQKISRDLVDSIMSLYWKKFPIEEQ